MKKFISFFLILVLLFSVTACTKSESGEEPTPVAEESVLRMLYDEENSTLNYLISGEWITSVS